MKKRLLPLAIISLACAGVVFAVDVWFNSAPSSVESGQSYYVEAEASSWYGQDCNVIVFKNSAYFAEAWDIYSPIAGAWTSDTGVQTVEYFAESYDYNPYPYWYDYASTYAWVGITVTNQAPWGVRDYSSGSVTQNTNLSANGWAVDNEMGAPVTRVDILIDGNDVGDANLSGYRPDVANAYGRSDFTYCGWSFSYNVGSLGIGTHSLELRAWDNQGASANFGYTTFQVTNATPSITLVSPSTQSITTGTALAITSHATDADGNIVTHNLDIQRPDGTWNWYGGFAYGEPYMGGPVGSAADSTRSATFTFNIPGVWYVRSWVNDANSNNLHSATVAIYVNTPPTVSWSVQPPASPGTGTTFTARATGNDTDGNLAAVSVDISVNGGGWSAFAYNGGGNGYTNTSDGNLVTAGSPGTTYQFRAQATDAMSGTSGLIYSSVATVASLNQSAPAITSAAGMTYGDAYTATATGGSGTGAFQWALGGGATAAGAAINPSSGAVTANSNGTVVIKVRRLGDSTYNDSPWSADFTVTVGARPITVNLSGSKTYNGSTAASGAAASITSGSLAPGDSVAYSYAATSGAAVGAYSGLATANVTNASAPTTRTGSYAISYTGAYSIYKATLYVTADNKWRNYGAANPGLTFSYSGFVNGETTAVLSGGPALGTSATTGSNVGAYPITVASGTLAATNYQFSFISGTLTVGKATLTVAADNKSRTYGTANPALTASYSGFLNGDTAAVLSGNPSLSTSATTGSSVGNYAISASAGTLAATNYQFSFGNGTLTITPASQPATGITSGDSVIYGNGYTATANGGAGTGAYEWALGTGSTASGAAIASSSGGVTANSTGSVVIKVRRLGDGNYTASAWSADYPVNVTARPITVTLAGSKAYDGSTASTGATASITSGSLAPGDTISYGFAAASSADPGNYSGLTSAAISNATSPVIRTESYAITHAGIYGIRPAPTVASGLRAWYKADYGVTKDGAGNVYGWADASGNGFDLAQADPSKQPVWIGTGFNGHAALEFASGKRLLTSAIDLQAGGNDLTVVIMFRPDAAQVDSASVLDHDSLNQQGFAFQQDGAADNRYLLRWRNQALDSWQGGAGPKLSVAASYQFVTVVKEGTVQSAYLNGSLQDSATVQSAMNKPVAVLAVGGGTTSATDYFTGQIAEILIYNRALTPAERAQVESDLGNRYSLADADGDGLPDWWELQYFGNLAQGPGGDPDGDGLTNLQEYILGTNPNSADTDGDGMPDGWEVAYGLNPRVNDAAGDLDGDGVSNLAEYQTGRDPTNRLDGLSLPGGSQLVLPTPDDQFLGVNTSTWQISTVPTP